MPKLKNKTQYNVHKISMSENRGTYCGKADSGHISPLFSLNSATIRLK